MHIWKAYFHLGTTELILLMAGAKHEALCLWVVLNIRAFPYRWS